MQTMQDIEREWDVQLFFMRIQIHDGLNHHVVFIYSELSNRALQKKIVTLQDQGRTRHPVMQIIHRSFSAPGMQ